MPSTRSSASTPGDDRAGRPSRAAIAVLVVASLAIPAGVLALILTRQSHHSAAVSVSPLPTDSTTPTTDVAPVDATKAQVGKLAPDFTLPTTSGKSLALSSLRGRPVVIAFFASWCQPCDEEMPVLQHFAQSDAGRLQVIGVSYQDLPSDTASFVDRLDITFPTLIDDPDGPTAQRYGVRGIPQTVFIDAQGIVRGRVYGQTSTHALEPAISDLLAGRNIRPV